MAELRPGLRRTTGLAGLGAAITFVAGNALWAFDQPNAGASAQEILTFYDHASTRIVAGGSLSLLSTALFALFASGWRTILAEVAGDDLLAATAFAGALLLMAAGLGAETVNMAGALRAHSGQLTPELGRAMFEISYALGYYAAGVGIGILLLATAIVGLRAQELLSRWLGTALLVTGLVFLTPLSQFLLVPAVLLLAVASARLAKAT